MKVGQKVRVTKYFLGNVAKQYEGTVLQVKRSGQFWVSRDGVEKTDLFMPNGYHTRSSTTVAEAI